MDIIRAIIFDRIREGFFVLNIHGSGTLFLSSFGAIHAVNLEADEEVIIDNSVSVSF